MKKIILLTVALAVAFGAAAASTRVKLGTLAPVGASYHKSLMKMAEAWRKDSNGDVNMVIFAGGAQGGEAEMVLTASIDLTLVDSVRRRIPIFADRRAEVY